MINSKVDSTEQLQKKESNEFKSDEAFSRNIGWLTIAEMRLLKNKRIAIAGLGGVGGHYLETLTRLGVGQFHIADFDSFEIKNLNRQTGSSSKTIGSPKIKVLENLAIEINPNLEIKCFPLGVNSSNIEQFLEGVDVYVDGLDFFALPIRREVFAACYRLGIPAVTAAPLGMGSATLTFMPGKMSFESYFKLEGRSEAEQYDRFLVGLAPSLMQRTYLAAPEAVNLIEKRGPSTPMACDLCAGIAVTQVLKILLKRGEVLAAPHGMHFDSYKNQLKKTWRPWGNDNPMNRIALILLRRHLNRIAEKESLK